MLNYWTQRSDLQLLLPAEPRRRVSLRRVRQKKTGAAAIDAAATIAANAAAAIDAAAAAAAGAAAAIAAAAAAITPRPVVYEYTSRKVDYKTRTAAASTAAAAAGYFCLRQWHSHGRAVLNYFS